MIHTPYNTQPSSGAPSGGSSKLNRIGASVKTNSAKTVMTKGDRVCKKKKGPFSTGMHDHSKTDNKARAMGMAKISMTVHTFAPLILGSGTSW